MTKKEKLEALKAFLTENKIDFYNDFCHRKYQVTPDLYIPKYRIVVKLSADDDQTFFEEVKHSFHPLYIRDEETAEFIVEKMQNLIISILKVWQRHAAKNRKKYE